MAAWQKSVATYGNLQIQQLKSQEQILPLFRLKQLVKPLLHCYSPCAQNTLHTRHGRKRSLAVVYHRESSCICSNNASNASSRFSHRRSTTVRHRPSRRPRKATRHPPNLQHPMLRKPLGTKDATVAMVQSIDLHSCTKLETADEASFLYLFHLRPNVLSNAQKLRTWRLWN